MRYRVMLLGLVVPTLLFASFDSRLAFAQDRQDQPLPRFRAGANLVRVDAYVSSKDGVALTDLKPGDFTVFEDDKPQKLESFELIQARGPIPQSERVDPTNVRDMRQQMQDSARVFTLYFDQYFVQLAGSFHARKPIIETLDKVIGPDDLVGAMTPLMAPTSVTYSKRTRSIESFLTETWHWGERFRDNTLSTPDPVVRGCQWGPESKILTKYREHQTLESLRSLVDYLEGLRPERKFVMVFTEGWPLYRPDHTMAGGAPPITDSPGVDPRTGGLRKPETTELGTPFRTEESCQRLQSTLALADHDREFRQLLQRANRANVSFYPIDARGLIVCDNPSCENGFAADAAIRRDRRSSMEDMAGATDGQVVIDASDVSKSMQKVFADVGSYYLLGYYSTNQRLDGRFRRIRLEVNRDDVRLRARPGYLAPTEAEARSAGAAVERDARPSPPPTVSRALDSLAPARGSLPVRVQAVGARNRIRAIVELDAATIKQPEWLSGGALRVTFEPERAPGAVATAQTVTVAIDPGQRSMVVDGTDQPLAPGRYSVRAELTARNNRFPLQVATQATVPAETADVGTGALALRRGPSTGLAYIPTADPRFRRTERLRVEVPLTSDGFTATGRVLTRDGQATALTVSFSVRADTATSRHFGVGEVVLAPLAEGEYVLELALVKGAVNEVVSYGFRIVP